jgi:hypothetical protein
MVKLYTIWEFYAIPEFIHASLYISIMTLFTVLAHPPLQITAG